MLKNLISKVKSQKTTSKSSIPQASQPTHHDQSINPHTLSQLSVTLPELSVVKGINTIHYAVLNDFPDISNAVLSCPLPFVQLPFGKRRVKQIDLNKVAPPPYIKFLLNNFEQLLFKPNHILINDYPVGVGIMSHFDGPAYHPKVVVYSIGTAVIEFTSEDLKHRVLLEDKSLHVFEEQAYTRFKHGVNQYGVDSIFALVNFDCEEPKLINSSVLNLQSTQIWKKVSKALNKQTKQMQIGRFLITRVEGNSEYNLKIESQRTRRISITIRHKYQ